MIFEDSRGKRPEEVGKPALGPGWRFSGAEKVKTSYFFWIYQVPRARKRGRPVERACRRLLKSALSKNELLPGVFGLCFAGFLKNFQFRFCVDQGRSHKRRFWPGKLRNFENFRSVLGVLICCIFVEVSPRCCRPGATGKEVFFEFLCWLQ